MAPRKKATTEVKTSAPKKKVTLADRIAAIENQLFLVFLQLNADTTLLVEKGILTNDEIARGMEELNEQLFAVTEDMLAKEAAQADAPRDPEAAITDEEN